MRAEQRALDKYVEELLPEDDETILVRQPPLPQLPALFGRLPARAGRRAAIVCAVLSAA